MNDVLMILLNIKLKPISETPNNKKNRYALFPIRRRVCICLFCSVVFRFDLKCICVVVVFFFNKVLKQHEHSDKKLSISRITLHLVKPGVGGGGEGCQGSRLDISYT